MTDEITVSIDSDDLVIRYRTGYERLCMPSIPWEVWAIIHYYESKFEGGDYA